MKNLPYILIALLAGFIIYKLFFPTIETEIEYVKGETVHDTVTVIKDSLIYVDRWHTKLDTFWTDPEGYIHASNWFDLQDGIVTGVVRFDQFEACDPEFSFSDIIIKQKIVENTITVTRVDTMKISKTITGGFSHGIQAGFGYGLINKQFDVFVGYGVSYGF